MKLKECMFVWSIGAIAYSAVEIMWRGYTHWSMAVTGGICFLIIYKTAMLKKPLILRALTSAMTITVIEFIVGYTLNIVFKLGVWDYSDMPLNIMGQICPLYSFFWFILSLIGVPFGELIRKNIPVLSR